MKQPIPQEAFDWYDEYAHGVIDRRTFLRKLGTLTAVGLSLGALTSEARTWDSGDTREPGA